MMLRGVDDTIAIEDLLSQFLARLAPRRRRLGRRRRRLQRSRLGRRRRRLGRRRGITGGREGTRGGGRRMMVMRRHIHRRLCRGGSHGALAVVGGMLGSSTSFPRRRR
jgi:hypothetical protein